MKVADAIGLQLDWMVAKCEGITTFGPPEGRSEAVEFLMMYSDDPALHYSTNWSQGGPIIEREKITTIYNGEDGIWNASHPAIRPVKKGWKSGTTPLIAAMRCYVASRLGDEIDVPEELL